jgi:hypothetical protein
MDGRNMNAPPPLPGQPRTVAMTSSNPAAPDLNTAQTTQPLRSATARQGTNPVEPSRPGDETIRELLKERDRLRYTLWYSGVFAVVTAITGVPSFGLPDEVSLALVIVAVVSAAFFASRHANAASFRHECIEAIALRESGCEPSALAAQARKATLTQKGDSTEMTYAVLLAIVGVALGFRYATWLTMVARWVALLPGTAAAIAGRRYAPIICFAVIVAACAPRVGPSGVEQRSGSSAEGSSDSATPVATGDARLIGFLSTAIEDEDERQEVMRVLGGSNVSLEEFVEAAFTHRVAFDTTPDNTVFLVRIGLYLERVRPRIDSGLVQRLQAFLRTEEHRTMMRLVVVETLEGLAASAVVPHGTSCAQAILQGLEEYKSGAWGPPDFKAGAHGAVLNRGDYLNTCRVPPSIQVEICTAIQSARAVGVTVSTSPPSPELASCIDGQVRAMRFPFHPRMDVARTTFAPVAPPSVAPTDSSLP